MSSGSPRERILTVLLVIVAGLLLLDAAPPSAVSSAGSGVSSSDMRARVSATLADTNPLLVPRERARIASAVVRYSGQYELDPELVTAILLVESSARPWARSPKGAIGLMQVMPHMMQPFELAGNAATIESNIEAGCRILSDNIRRLGVERGVSAYFWGSDIRGVAYLEKVQERLAAIRGERPS